MCRSRSSMRCISRARAAGTRGWRLPWGAVTRSTGSGVRAAQRTAVALAVGGFAGDATVAGFRPAGADAVAGVTRRFTVPVKRGPLAVPAVRLLVGDLVEGRAFTIERTPVTSFAVA